MNWKARKTQFSYSSDQKVLTTLIILPFQQIWEHILTCKLLNYQIQPAEPIGITKKLTFRCQVWYIQLTTFFLQATFPFLLEVATEQEKKANTICKEPHFKILILEKQNFWTEI